MVVFQFCFVLVIFEHDFGHSFNHLFLCFVQVRSIRNTVDGLIPIMNDINSELPEHLRLDQLSPMKSEPDADALNDGGSAIT